jgi:hypothetical protein
VPHPVHLGSLLRPRPTCCRLQATGHLWPVAVASQPLADWRPPNRTPSTGRPPSRCLYQTPAAMGGRADHP